MEIKKLNRKDESDLRDILKNSCSKIWLVYLKQSRSSAVKFVRKIPEAYLGLCWTAIAELFCESSKQLKDINHFCKKNLIIGFWHGPKFASEDFFFKNL